MTRWRPQFDPQHLYFVTTTAAGRARFFERDVMKRLLVDNLHDRRTIRQIKLYAFVVMPNHVHLILQAAAEVGLAGWMRDFKTSVAKSVIWQLEAEGNQPALDKLASAVKRPGKQRYKVWEDGYVAKEVFSPGFLKQKIEYVHGNPCQPQWQLAERPELYPWSSARYYLLDRPAVIPVDDARVLLGLERD